VEYETGSHGTLSLSFSDPHMQHIHLFAAYQNCHSLGMGSNICAATKTQQFLLFEYDHNPDQYWSVFGNYSRATPRMSAISKAIPGLGARQMHNGPERNTHIFSNDKSCLPPINSATAAINYLEIADILEEKAGNLIHFLTGRARVCHCLRSNCHSFQAFSDFWVFRQPKRIYPSSRHSIWGIVASAMVYCGADLHHLGILRASHTQDICEHNHDIAAQKVRQKDTKTSAEAG
jgi:hypothetical protein